jgi:hypothetical protein
MDLKTAIETADVDALHRLLREAPHRADEVIRWGDSGRIATHPLHYVSDMLFSGILKNGKELPLVDALIQAGSNVDFHPAAKETPLIGAASLGAEEVGLRLLDAGARPERRGIFGETALHWAALMGEDRLAGRLLEGSDLNLKDEKYHSSALGWAIHGWNNPPAGNCGRQAEVIMLLVAAGAEVQPNWLETEKVRSAPAVRAALQAASA